MTQFELFPEEPEEPEEPEQDASPERPWTISELTAAIKDLLETAFPAVWVSGEISNFSRPRSGHCYLTLKDEGAQISAVIWRATAARVPFELHDGLEVVCGATLSLYPPHGKYQLVIEEIQPKGIGALELALRQLRDKLAREGLFDPGRKRSLPRFVRRIAVVTSPTGAAIRDFLEVLRRRWRGADVLVVPVRVQGEGAGREIAAAIEAVNRIREPIDCIVVTRGGGSLEDLWAFNEEVVCRAIFASRLPVVSAVGHEIDVSLSDLVADVRALTPSEAAERIVPSSEEIAAQLKHYQTRMSGAVRSQTAWGRSRLENLARHRAFRSPLDRVRDLARRIDELELRAGRAIRGQWRTARRAVEGAAARLEALSPLAILARGYSLTHRAVDGRLIRDAAELAPGDGLRTRFARGQVVSRVERVEPDR
ncbi:MAG: exodeoxyribonuclease VII large subunit [Thermoguttaceae bacterium]|nr:exodeoxyribonuclease VII large subunit [Thermoguttaceae bacterium]